MDESKLTLSAVLQQNVLALMGSKLGPTTQMELQRKAKVGQATVGRILNQEGGENAKIETIAKIAKAYGLEGWQLLVAGMDPHNPPVIQPVSQAERALYDRLKAAAKDIAKLTP